MQTPPPNPHTLKVVYRLFKYLYIKLTAISLESIFIIANRSSEVLTLPTLSKPVCDMNFLLVHAQLLVYAKS